MKTAIDGMDRLNDLQNVLTNKEIPESHKIYRATNDAADLIQLLERINATQSAALEAIVKIFKNRNLDGFYTPEGTNEAVDRIHEVLWNYGLLQKEGK